jgi:hypothetical protein
MKKTIVTIPFHFDRDENPFVLFDKIILDILEFYKEKKYDRIVDILTSYLGVNDHQCIPILDLKTRHGIERQRVEQILFLEIGLKRLFFEKHYRNYNIHPEALIKLRAFFDQKLEISNPMVQSAIENNWSIEKLKIVLSFFGNSLFVSKNGKYIIFPNNYFMFFNKVYNKYEQSLKRSILPISIESIEVDMELLELFKKIDEYPIDYQEGYISMRWYNLSSLENRAKRIIWESNKMISRHEILVEYNKRVKLYKEVSNLKLITENEMILRQCKHFKAQKNGYWEYQIHEKKKINLFLEDIFKEKDQINYQEILDKVKDAGYVYSDRSIRNYVLKFAYAKENEPYIFIKKTDAALDIPKRQYGIKNVFVNQAITILKKNALDRDQAIKQIVKKCEDNSFKISVVGAKQYLKKYSEIPYDFWTLYKNQFDVIMVSLNEERVADLDLEKFGLKEEKAYIKNLRSLIVNSLKRMPGNKSLRSNLKKEFISILPSSIKHNNFYKVINKFEEIEISDQGIVALKQSKNDKIEVSTSENIEEITERIRKKYDWSVLKPRLKKELSTYISDPYVLNNAIDLLYDNLSEKHPRELQSLLQFMFEFFFAKNDDYDRDSYFFKFVVSYEPYLKTYWNYPKDIKGLYEVIKTFDVLFELFQYKFKVKSNEIIEIDREKHMFSKIINSLLYYRNQCTHDDVAEVVKLNTAAEIKYIIEFIALYVYTSNFLTQK